MAVGLRLKRVGIRDYPRLKGFFAGQRYRLCEYSLPNILIWSNDLHRTCVAEVDGGLLIGYESADHVKNRHLILPVSPGPERSPEELRDLADAAGFHSYALVPVEYVERFGRGRVESCFEIVPLPRYADYVYRAADLAELPGRKYAKKRNLVRRFTREFVGEGRVTVERLTPGAVDDGLAFLDEWCRERECDAAENEDLAHERDANALALRNADLLEMQGLLLRIDGTVSALALGARLTDDMWVTHFEKAFGRVKGLYQFFNRECARVLFTGTEYVNKENDLGVPGLAKSKQSYHPVTRVECCRLNVR